MVSGEPVCEGKYPGIGVPEAEELIEQTWRAEADSISKLLEAIMYH